MTINFTPATPEETRKAWERVEQSQERAAQRIANDEARKHQSITTGYEASFLLDIARDVDGQVNAKLQGGQ